jgi:hypothetical protein
MLIAREKRKTNIAEYILYMWQVEDTIRAFGFDMDRLEVEIIDGYDQPDEVKKEMREWYENIALHMKNEKVEKSGHVQFIKNIIKELNDFHLSILNKPDNPAYFQMYTSVLPLIREMNAKQKWSSENEIETCLNAVYIYLMMRLRKDKVSEETTSAMDMFVKFLAILSERFRSFELGL